MKKLSCLIILFVACSICEGQNLVANGDFETYSSCPPNIDYLSNAAPWINPALLTPDYFNQCSPGNAGVPLNVYGDQVAHSGTGYAGAYGSQIDAQPDVREYIAAPLLQPLQSGATYFVQFYVNLSGYSQYGVTSLGAYFSPSLTLPLSGYVLNVIPQVENTSAALTDTAGWMEISGTFTAFGGEQYIVIGNFRNDTSSGIQNVSWGSWNSAYYFIDDVTVLLQTGIEEQNAGDENLIYPNPVGEEFLVSGLKFPVDEKTVIKIYDALGKEAQPETRNLTPGTKINVSILKKGIYFIEISDGKNNYGKKFIKE